VSFTRQPLYPSERRLGRSHSRSGHGSEEKNSCYTGRPAHSYLVTVLPIVRIAPLIKRRVDRSINQLIKANYLLSVNRK
jgi:hypothetical protein